MHDIRNIKSNARKGEKRVVTIIRKILLYNPPKPFVTAEKLQY